MDVQGADGQTITKTAVATGLNFFQAQKERDETGQANLDQIRQQNLMDATLLNAKKGQGWAANAAATDGFGGAFIDKAEFDPYVHQLIDLEKCHSDYRRFNSRYDDYELELDDVINVLIPAKPESSNILLFELVLLESATVSKDYVVGWGVFPIVNSEFAVNEGKFKCPILFGNVNVQFDKFLRIEQQMIDDLDNWLCNLYFEIEKVNLVDLQIDEKSGELFFAPVHQLVRKKRVEQEPKEADGNKNTYDRRKSFASSGKSAVTSEVMTTEQSDDKSLSFGLVDDPEDGNGSQEERDDQRDESDEFEEHDIYAEEDGKTDLSQSLLTSYAGARPRSQEAMQ